MSLFVLEWLPSLKREIEAPDLWAELQHAKSLFEFVGHDDRQPITEDERSRLPESLSEIKQWLLHNTPNQTDEQLELINSRFDYLESALRRLSRTDWIHTAIGVFFTLGVGLGLAPSKARELFTMFSNTIEDIFGDVTKFLQ